MLVNRVAAAGRRLMTEPDHYRDMTARGRANAARFSWERAVQRTLAVYRQAAGG